MIARGFASAGAEVVVAARSAEGCAQTVKELSELGPAWSVSADVATGSGRQRLVEELTGRYDRLDVLVHCAGTAWGARFEEFPEAAWDRTFELNLKAPFYLTQALLPALEASAQPGDPGRVITIGSLDGIRITNQPTFSYGASKAALHHLTRVLARQLGPRGITFNVIAPGPFHSRANASLKEAGEAVAAQTALRRLGEPDDMVGAAVFLASRAASYVTGSVIPVDGGLLLSYGTGRADP
jgi:NAD(P)-dependent dehydrogenase (short-subunit alcohol dehydrogenase family)